MAEDDQGEWLGLAEAARRLGWPRERLRSLARRGKVRTMRGNAGQLMVLVTPGLEGQATVDLAQPSLAHGPAQEARPTQPDLAQVARLEAAEADLRAELLDARVAQARAEGENTALRERVADLKEQLEHERQQLERARQPFWRRWRR
jgi:hypothetical protein